MNVRELMNVLAKCDDDRVVVISDSDGCWSNIDDVYAHNPAVDSCVHISIEEFPVFSES